MEKGLVIIDRKDYNVNKRFIKDPKIIKVLRYGNGWIEVRMTNGFAYRRSGGTLSWRYCHPGNIKYGRFARAHGAIGRGWGRHGGHAVFPTHSIGRHAQRQLLFTPVRKYYNMSLIDALSLYAPVSDNNRPDIYSRFILRRIPGVTFNTRLRDFNREQQGQMLAAMQQFEGHKAGRIERI